MAWTITATEYKTYNICSPMGSEMIVLKLACESDGSGVDLTLEAILGARLWRMIRGGWLYSAIIIPGTGDDVPSAAFNFDIQNEHDMSKISVTDHAVDANTENTGSDEFGRFAVVEDDDAFTVATLGDGNTMDVYIYIMKG